MKPITRMLMAISSGAVLTLAGCGGQAGVTNPGTQAAPPVETVVTITQTPQNEGAVKTPATGNDADKISSSDNVATGTNANHDDPYAGPRDHKNRYENMLLPAGAKPANEAARQGMWRSEKYSLVYTGNDSTSTGFANEIHKSWVAVADPNKINGPFVFDVWSEAAQKVFKVNCNEGPKYVTCTGGTNAVVYIV